MHHVAPGLWEFGLPLLIVLCPRCTQRVQTLASLCGSRAHSVLPRTAEGLEAQSLPSASAYGGLFMMYLGFQIFQASKTILLDVPNAYGGAVVAVCLCLWWNIHDIPGPSNSSRQLSPSVDFEAFLACCSEGAWRFDCRWPPLSIVGCS